MTAKDDSGRIQVLMWALGILIAITAAINSWSITRIISQGERITAVESRQFNAKDGLEVWKEIADLKQTVALIDQQMGMHIKITQAQGSSQDKGK